MKNQELRDMLEKLHNELKSVHSLDDNARELLLTLMNDIQKILHQPSYEDSSTQNHTLIEQLTKAIHFLEESHPRLVLTMRQMIDTLSNMGI